MHKLINSSLESFYRCPMDPEYWQPSLDEICKIFHARSAILSLVSGSGSSDHHWVWSARDSLSFVERKHFDTYLMPSKNPRAQVSPPKLPSILTNDCVSIRDKDLFKQDKKRHQQINTILKKLELGPFLGIRTPLEGGGFLSFSLYRSRENQNDFSTQEEGAAHYLMPHLRRCVLLSQHINIQAKKIDSLEKVLNQSPFGVVLYDSKKHAYAINKVAKHMLNGHHKLRLEGLKLITESPKTTEQLHQRILSVIANKNNLQSPDFITPEAYGLQDLQIQVLAVDDSLLKDQAYKALSVHKGAAILLLADTSSVATPTSKTIIKLLGVSPAEAVIVESLCKGESLNEHAKKRGISINTARFQLKQVFLKTNTSSQIQLLRLVFTSSAGHWLD